MLIELETVTPTKAEKWLNLNNGNRKMRPGVAEKYAADMLAGRWTSCPTPISFYADGDVADGQHRLWAIVESGVSIKFPIVRGLKREDGLNIDTGLGRSLVDNAHISGRDMALSNQLISVARAVHDGTASKSGGKQRSNAARLELVQQYRECCDWALSHAPKGRNINNSITISAMARAYMREPNRDRLARFAEVLSTGFYESKSDTAAVALRTYLLQKGATATVGANWRDTFLKVQHAIHQFMRGTPLSIIKTVSTEDYPLDAKAAQAAFAARVGKQRAAEAKAARG